MEYLWEALEKLQLMYFHDQFVWNVVFGVFLIAIGAYFPWKKPQDLWRGIVARRERKNFIRNTATQDFVDKTEDRVADGFYTRDEATELYRDMKKCFPIRNLFASTERLKDDIKKRLASGLHTPVTLPKVEGKPKRKHLFDKPAKV